MNLDSVEVGDLHAPHLEHDQVQQVADRLFAREGFQHIAENLKSTIGIRPDDCIIATHGVVKAEDCNL